MFELIQSIRIADGVATGIAEIAAGHPGLIDHFPGHPVLPGTWLVELAAQIAGPLAETVVQIQQGVERWAVLAMIRDAKFLLPVGLPARVEIEARIERGARRQAEAPGTAFGEGRGTAVDEGRGTAAGEGRGSAVGEGGGSAVGEGPIAASGERIATRHTRVRVSARCADSVVLRADLVFALVEAPRGSEAAVRARRERVARWMAS